MEPAAKKPKFETSTKQYEFLDMNDDCITLVLEQLLKNDLCSTSFACTRLRELAYAVHMRKFPNKVITINAQRNYRSVPIKYDVVLDVTDEKYLKYMSKAIRNVEVLCTRKGIREYFKVLKNECSPNLKSLKIHRARSNMSSIPWSMIKDQLKNVEKLSIEALPNKGISTIHKNWLSCCQKLRELSITTQFCNGEWMLDVYPELESLQIHLLKINFQNDSFAKYAAQFMQRQPKLKEIKCVNFNTTRLLLQGAADNIPRLIVDIQSFGWNRLTSDEDESFDQLVNEFKNYREKGRIEWLEFALDHEIGDTYQLSKVDAVHPVKGLRTELSGPIGQSMIEMLKHLVHLELTFKPRMAIDWTHLSNELKHLETLKLSFLSYGNVTALDITKPFVRNMPQLKLLDVVAGEWAVIEDNHLLQLNAARLLVKNPVHLHVNIELLMGNTSTPIIPNSNILTANVLRTYNDSSKDSSDDSSSDDSESDGSSEDLFWNDGSDDYFGNHFYSDSDEDEYASRDSDDSNSAGCILC